MVQYLLNFIDKLLFLESFAFSIQPTFIVGYDSANWTPVIAHMVKILSVSASIVDFLDLTFRVNLLLLLELAAALANQDVPSSTQPML